MLRSHLTYALNRIQKAEKEPSRPIIKTSGFYKILLHIVISSLYAPRPSDHSPTNTANTYPTNRKQPATEKRRFEIRLFQEKDVPLYRIIYNYVQRHEFRLTYRHLTY